MGPARPGTDTCGPGKAWHSHVWARQGLAQADVGPAQPCVDPVRPGTARCGPGKAQLLLAVDKKQLHEHLGKQALGKMLNTHQIRVTNCNDKAALAGWMAGSEIPVQTVLCSGHSLSQGKAGAAAKNPSASSPHPLCTLQSG